MVRQTKTGLRPDYRCTPIAGEVHKFAVALAADARRLHAVVHQGPRTRCRRDADHLRPTTAVIATHPTTITPLGATGSLPTTIAARTPVPDAVAAIRNELRDLIAATWQFSAWYPGHDD